MLQVLSFSPLNWKHWSYHRYIFLFLSFHSVALKTIVYYYSSATDCLVFICLIFIMSYSFIEGSRPLTVITSPCTCASFCKLSMCLMCQWKYHDVDHLVNLKHEKGVELLVKQNTDLIKMSKVLVVKSQSLWKNNIIINNIRHFLKSHNYNC